MWTLCSHEGTKVVGHLPTVSVPSSFPGTTHWWCWPGRVQRAWQQATPWSSSRHRWAWPLKPANLKQTYIYKEHTFKLNTLHILFINSHFKKRVPERSTCMHEEVRRQFPGVCSLLLPCEIWESTQVMGFGAKSFIGCTILLTPLTFNYQKILWRYGRWGESTQNNLVTMAIVWGPGVYNLWRCRNAVILRCVGPHAQLSWETNGWRATGWTPLKNYVYIYE